MPCCDLQQYYKECCIGAAHLFVHRDQKDAKDSFKMNLLSLGEAYAFPSYFQLQILAI